MSTLSKKEDKQLENAFITSKGVNVDKSDVLRVVIDELKKKDKDNKFITDTHEVQHLKNVYNKLIKL